MGAQTTILRPVDSMGGGHYRAGARATGLTALAAGAPVLSFRWINTDLFVQIHAIAWGWFLSTAFGAAQIVDHGLYKATGFSGSDTGGAVIVPTPKRAAGVAMKPLVAATDFDLRIGALSAGTRVLGTDWIAGRGAWAGAIGAGIMPPAVVPFDVEHEGNLILGPNEGVVLTNLTLMGATGVLALYAELAFSVLKPENVTI